MKTVHNSYNLFPRFGFVGAAGSDLEEDTGVVASSRTSVSGIAWVKK